MMELTTLADSDNSNNIQSDYDRSRATYYDLISKGQDALELMIEVARESEHPRAFEVLATLIKNTSDVNDKLMDLNKKHKDINRSEDATAPAIGGNTTNNVYVGSTSDLQRMLQEVEKTAPIDVTPVEDNNE